MLDMLGITRVMNLMMVAGEVGWPARAAAA
jgi:hypothetical protein